LLPTAKLLEVLCVVGVGGDLYVGSVVCWRCVCGVVVSGVVLVGGVVLYIWAEGGCEKRPC
jgi:hypothetical protein